MTPKLLLTLALAILLTVFVLQNTAVVEVRFLWWTVSMSRALLIVLLLAVGVALGWSAHGIRALRRKR